MHSTGLLYSLQGRVLYVRARTSQLRPPATPANRGKITGFSVRSSSRMRRYLRSCDARYRVMGTLTYPAQFPTSGRAVKAHLRAFLERCRRYFSSAGIEGWSVFWFLEFQERGAPHFHFFTTHEIPKDLLADWWFDIVNSGDPNHRLAGTRIEFLKQARGATVAYAAKYAAKAGQKDVPAGFECVGRFWGVAGLVSCHSLFLLVPFDLIDSTLHRSLEKELRDALKGSDGYWKRIDFGERAHLCRGITMFDDELAAKVEAILHRYGLLLSTHYDRVIVEYPAIGLIPDGGI